MRAQRPDGDIVRCLPGLVVNDRRDMAASVFIIALVAGYLGYRAITHVVAEAPTQKQCSQLLDRYLEHASRARDPEVGRGDIDQVRETSLGTPKRVADVRSCISELSKEQVECGLEAHNIDQLEQCVQ